MLGLFLEDIDEGLSVDLGSYHFTRESIVKFAKKYDPQPFHVDEEAGLRGPFGKLSASGWHTASGWMKCFVATNNAARTKLLAMGKLSPEVGPSPGFTNLKWLKAGLSRRYGSLSLYGTSGKRVLATRPQWGLVFSLNEGFNQNDDLVFSFEGKVLTARR